MCGSRSFRLTANFPVYILFSDSNCNNRGASGFTQVKEKSRYLFCTGERSSAYVNL